MAPGQDPRIFGNAPGTSHEQNTVFLLQLGGKHLGETEKGPRCFGRFGAEALRQSQNNEGVDR